MAMASYANFWFSFTLTYFPFPLHQICLHASGITTIEANETLEAAALVKMFKTLRTEIELQTNSISNFTRQYYCNTFCNKTFMALLNWICSSCSSLAAYQWQTLAWSVKDRDTLIEQLSKYSNRTVTAIKLTTVKTFSSNYCIRSCKITISMHLEVLTLKICLMP